MPIDAADTPAARLIRLWELLNHLLLPTTRAGYAITVSDDESRTITCLICGRRSFNVQDIQQKYCGHCHVFHEER